MNKFKILMSVFFLFLFHNIIGQVKSNAVTLQIQSKSVNAFEIELPQKLDYVTEIFKIKFEVDQLGVGRKIENNFQVFNQINFTKISTSFLDFYYQINENKTDNGSYTKITVLVSKGYDNFITFENDKSASQNILDLLDELGVSVERKNLEIFIAKKEQDVMQEKQKLLLLEEELLTIENQKKEIEKNIALKNSILTAQAKTTLDIANDLEKSKKALSDFEKNISTKNKTTLRKVSEK